MGSSNSVPAELQGRYFEKKEVQQEGGSIDYEYKLDLKETEFELQITNSKWIRKPDGNGGTFSLEEMALLLGKVEEHGDEKKGEEVTINFKTDKASHQKGGGGFGIPMPDDNYKGDFVMKLSKVTNDRGTFHALTFVTYPKLKWDDLSGTLLGKKC